MCSYDGFFAIQRPHLHALLHIQLLHQYWFQCPLCFYESELNPVSNLIHFLKGFFFILQDKALDLNIDSQDASFLIAVIGIANTVGRIITGYVSDKTWLNRLFLYNTALAISGIGNRRWIDRSLLFIFHIVLSFRSYGSKCFLHHLHDSSYLCCGLWSYNWSLCRVDLSRLSRSARSREIH